MKTIFYVLAICGSLYLQAACPGITTNFTGTTGRIEGSDDAGGGDVCTYDPTAYSNGLQIRNGRTLDVYGNMTIEGDFTIYGTINVYGTITVEGSLTIDGNGQFNVQSTGTVNIDGDFNNGGWLSGLVPIEDVGTKTGGTISGAVNVTGDFNNSMDGNLTVANGGDLGVGGDFNNNDGADINVDSGGDLGVTGDFNANTGSQATIAGGGTMDVGGTTNNSGGEILPVELVSFTVEILSDKTSQLTWQTASELNNDGFYIERAYAVVGEELIFSSIDFVPGNGTISTLIDYSFVDQTIKADAYYRLKQVDFDGAFEYSPMIFVEYPFDFSIDCYPNPFTSEVRINIAAGEYEYQLFDASGLEIMHENVSGYDLERHINDVFISSPAGLYHLVVSNGETIIRHKLVKSN